MIILKKVLISIFLAGIFLLSSCKGNSDIIKQTKKVKDITVAESYDDVFRQSAEIFLEPKNRCFDGQRTRNNRFGH